MVESCSERLTQFCIAILKKRIEKDRLQMKQTVMKYSA